jgi:O-acetylhomoserine/O-acetylserine sulfhydrylase-like pyridoxal-dependent enzyme
MIPSAYLDPTVEQPNNPHSKRYALATRCAHGGAHGAGSSQTNVPIQPPIVQSSIFALGTSAEAETIFSGAREGFAYLRFRNPTVERLAISVRLVRARKKTKPNV